MGEQCYKKPYRGGKGMNKYPLIGFSILAVILLVLGSLSNVVGYESVQTSQQNLIKERINQEDLLFQTICDLVNNKETQKVILKSQDKFLKPFPPLQLTSIPIITKKQLNLMYHLGEVLSKTMIKTRMTSLARAHPILTNQTKDKINAIIESNIKLKEEKAQLSALNCPSCSEAKGNWSFPIICTVLHLLFNICFVIMAVTSYPHNYLALYIFCIFALLTIIVGGIFADGIFHCNWV
jgi:hypothetical protein